MAACWTFSTKKTLLVRDPIGLCWERQLENMSPAQGQLQTISFAERQETRIASAKLTHFYGAASFAVAPIKHHSDPAPCFCETRLDCKTRTADAMSNTRRRDPTGLSSAPCIIHTRIFFPYPPALGFCNNLPTDCLARTLNQIRIKKGNTQYI